MLYTIGHSTVDLYTMDLPYLSKHLDFDFLEWDLIESFNIIRATLAPLRLTRWQMFRYMIASLFRGMSTLFLVLLGVGSLTLLAFLSQMSSRRNTAEKLGIPVVGGSKQHKLDFKAAVEEGKRLVRTDTTTTACWSDTL